MDYPLLFVLRLQALLESLSLADAALSLVTLSRSAALVYLVSVARVAAIA